MTIALDMLERRDDAVALPFATFSTKGRDGAEIVAKGQGTPRAEPLSNAMWSAHECLVWLNEGVSS